MSRSKEATFGADIEVFIAPLPTPERVKIEAVRKPDPRMIGGLEGTLGQMTAQAIANNMLQTTTISSESVHWVTTEEQIASFVDVPIPGALQTLPTAKKLRHRGMSGQPPPPFDKKNLINRILPCVGLFPGTKEKPHTPKDWPEGFAIQEDNVMLEFNVPVAHTSQQFYKNIRIAKALVEEICRAQKLIPVWRAPEHNFNKKALLSSQAQTFACDPDNDAYEEGHQRSSPPDFGRLRTCGGHIHIGGEFNCPDFVAVLFLELSFAMHSGPQFVVSTRDKRPMWYGKPGTFRSKPYGIEYRTLSNQWVLSTGGISETARVMSQVANTLINTPAKTLQTWFRGVDWLNFHEVLMTSPSRNTTDDMLRTYQKRYSQVQEQWSHLHFIGAS